MRIIITVDQLKRILQTEPVYLPITLNMDKITKGEFQEISVLLDKKRG